MKTIAGVGRLFNLIKRTVLAALNTFLKDTTNTSPGFGLRINFRCSSSNVLSGLFYEDETYGLLEASDDESTDQVMSFLGAVA